MCFCQWVSHLRHNICLMSSHRVVSLRMTFFCSPSIISASAGLRVCVHGQWVCIYIRIYVCARIKRSSNWLQKAQLFKAKTARYCQNALSLYLSPALLHLVVSQITSVSLALSNIVSLPLSPSRKPEDSKQNISKHDSRGATEAANADFAATTKTATATACQHIFVHWSSRRQSSQGRGRGPRRRPRPEPFGDNTLTEQVLKVKLENGDKEHMM